MGNRNGNQKQGSHDSQAGSRPAALAFLGACTAVVGRSALASAVTEGSHHVLRYANPSFFELTGRRRNEVVGSPVVEAFPDLFQAEWRAVLRHVYGTGQAARCTEPQRYSHPRRGNLSLVLSAWPCGKARAPSMTLLQCTELPLSWRSPLGTLARDLRAVNERLLVTGMRERELAEETTRRLVVAEEAAERSERALRSSAVYTENLSRRLIAAQEEERTRLARELHDDVNQQLAGLSIALSALSRTLTENPVAALADVERLKQRSSTLIETVRALSHELHPGSLRSAGLVPALRHLCAEFEPPESIELHLVGDLTALPSDISLILYRVTQEAVRNVMRHADAQHVDVGLVRDENGIQLAITDDGRGFVPSEVHSGLGLLSMEERVLVVNGTLTINSIPGMGTCVSVTIPGETLQTQAASLPSPLAGPDHARAE